MASKRQLDLIDVIQGVLETWKNNGVGEEDDREFLRNVVHQSTQELELSLDDSEDLYNALSTIHYLLL